MKTLKAIAWAIGVSCLFAACAMDSDESAPRSIILTGDGGIETGDGGIEEDQSYHSLVNADCNGAYLYQDLWEYVTRYDVTQDFSFDGDTLSITKIGDTGDISDWSVSFTGAGCADDFVAAAGAALTSCPDPVDPPVGGGLDAGLIYAPGDPAADPCRTEGRALDRENRAAGVALAAVAAAAWKANVPAYLAASAAYLNAKRNQHDAAKAVGACCRAADPGFTTPACSAVWWQYWPLRVP